jgi:hypothetical protein
MRGVVSPRWHWRRCRNQDRELPEVLGGGGKGFGPCSLCTPKRRLVGQPSPSGLAVGPNGPIGAAGTGPGRITLTPYPAALDPILVVFRLPPSSPRRSRRDESARILSI